MLQRCRCLNAALWRPHSPTHYQTPPHNQEKLQLKLSWKLDSERYKTWSPNRSSVRSSALVSISWMMQNSVCSWPIQIWLYVWLRPLGKEGSGINVQFLTCKIWHLKAIKCAHVHIKKPFNQPSIGCLSFVTGRCETCHFHTEAPRCSYSSRL